MKRLFVSGPSLLGEQRRDDAWFSALESVLAETAVAVTAARQSLIKALNDEAAKGWFGFPGVKLLLAGEVEVGYPKCQHWRLKINSCWPQGWRG